jgi:glycosyltransferase involved in cell wall biosynthesis
MTVNADHTLTMISIITTIFNREAYLGQTIESVLAQTMPSFEYILWDDGSTDASFDIAMTYAKQDKRIRVFKSQPSGTTSIPFSLAIQQSQQPYFGSVDSDDLLYPQALENILKTLKKHPNAGMIYTDHEQINEDGSKRWPSPYVNTPHDNHDMYHSLVMFPFRFIRREAYNYVGGIDISFRYAMDYDLCLKLSECCQIIKHPEVLYQYRRHEQTISNSHKALQLDYSLRAMNDALKRRGFESDWEYIKENGLGQLRSKTTLGQQS